MPDASTRHQVELLVDEAGLDLPLTQWPLPRAAVQRAIDALPATLPDALDAARSHVERSLRAQDESRLTLRLRNKDEAIAGFGDDATAGTSLGVRSRSWSADRLAVQLGGRVDPAATHGGQFRLDDSAVATELLGWQLQAWAHRSWWGPGWQGSLVLGNNAPPFAGVGFQRASASTSTPPLLAWLGPWNFEFFVAQDEGGRHAFFVGNRFTFKPWRRLEIGLTRTAQWGGAGHPNSVKSFAKMLLGIGVNPNTPAEVPEDPANEMSGYDLRLRCGDALRCAVYTQLIGEDATHGWPGRFLGLYGIESWSADGTQRWFGEFAETLCGGFREHNPMRPCAYRNHGYPEGYASAGRWIGSPFGPDSRVLTLGWIDAAGGTTLRVHRGRIGSRVGSFSALDHDPQTSGPLLGLSARQAFQWEGIDLVAELDWLHVRAPDGAHTDARIGLQWRASLD
ncbi:MAG TPA: capsule assembly Wzi family protein, partial [Albitalea sp.]|nr:capsule assembly Wzi family protein [Albitalea sp.]